MTTRDKAQPPVRTPPRTTSTTSSATAGDSPTTKKIITALGGVNAEVELWRRNGADWEFVDSVDGQALTLQAVKEVYKHGKYQARWVDPDSGDSLTQDFAIARDIRDSMPAPTQSAPSSLERAFDKMMERMERLEDKLTTRQTTAPDRTHELILALIGRPLPQLPAPDNSANQALRDLAIALAGKNEGGEKMSTLELLKLLQSERDSAMEIAERLLEAKSGGETSDIAEIARTIRDVGGPLAGKIADRIGAENNATRGVPPGKPVAVVNPPQTNATLPVAQNVTPKPPENEVPLPPWIQSVYPVAGMIRRWILSGVDDWTPKADLLLEALDDAQIAELGHTLKTMTNGEIVALLTRIPVLKDMANGLTPFVEAVRGAHDYATKPETPDDGAAKDE